ncbi:MAG: hypothetical protein LBN97_06240 [Oscillospiraceae bacterium]|jgi:hypothetical protein|nr:hypothetical protein [Oscillospiraceae bacterium]
MNEDDFPKISPNFTVDDIRAIRDYYGERDFLLPRDELLARSRAAGEEAEARRAKLKNYMDFPAPLEVAYYEQIGL